MPLISVSEEAAVLDHNLRWSIDLGCAASVFASAYSSWHVHLISSNHMAVWSSKPKALCSVLKSLSVSANAHDSFLFLTFKPSLFESFTILHKKNPLWNPPHLWCSACIHINIWSIMVWGHSNCMLFLTDAWFIVLCCHNPKAQSDCSFQNRQQQKERPYL